MKTPVFPRMVALLSLSAIIPLSAQNLVSTSRFSEIVSKTDDLDGNSDRRFTESVTLSGSYEVPALEKIKASPTDGHLVYAAQIPLTLDSQDWPG